ncbi:MAG TPA: hypothetical protein VGI66_11070 [Streptosporangiaceae bacterium]
MDGAIRGLTRRVLATSAFAALTVTAALPLLALPAHASEAAAAGGKLTLTNLAFAQQSVDASGGGSVVDLNWEVKDSSAAATSVSGDVKIRMAGPQSGTFVGLTYDVPFSLAGFTPGLTSSGTAQDSSYSFAFTVPQYSFASTARWDVTQVIVQDDQGQRLNLSGNDLNRYSGSLTATELVDSTAPTYDSLGFPVAIGPSRPYVYNGGSGGSSSYGFNADDAQSGFWKGVLTLAGPGGQTLSASFSDVFSIDNQYGTCGAGIVFDDTSAQCQPAVTIPASAAPGTWTVSKLQLWDNAGNHATYRNLNVLPITVTSNSIIKASGFAASPTQVNNWVQTQTVQVSMNVTGAQGGVSAVYVDFTAGSPCTQQATTPTLNPDGTYSVPVSMFSIANSCTVDGIAIVDGNGDVSVYGAEYGEPDLGIELTRLPDTTPPVANGASLSPTSLTQSPNSQFVDLTVEVSDAIAPVTQMGETIFDSSGHIVGGGSGGVVSTLTGPVVTSVPVPAGLPPGTYTVAFDLTDAGGLTSFYGYPNTQPVPGGPLTFTITP